MNVFPDEDDLLSLFECEPTLFDTTEKGLPFYHNKATYQFSNGEEDFIVTLSPSYGEVKIQVTLPTSNKLLSLLDLKRVEKFEITADKRELSSVLLTVLNEDSQQTIEIDFKPKYKLIFREHYTR
ncbi:hypothetical protein [Peribacillus sp. ACCC06369]|uniref:hypothetical protein n=1 Tax=Peribacillus sp. ACCC06369 TaxID=3055860 RepID=UPI00259FE2A3|nr:hypothetical protein [Peribacillus sp. ACCC06369]MDM5360380.1 hypothetical protein [Peribacillus sp. ACCC06369]